MSRRRSPSLRDALGAVLARRGDAELVERLRIALLDPRRRAADPGLVAEVRRIRAEDATAKVDVIAVLTRRRRSDVLDALWAVRNGRAPFPSRGEGVS